MVLSSDSVFEIWSADDVSVIPLGTAAQHLASNRPLGEGSRLHRRDRSGEILIWHNRLTVELPDVTVAVPSGSGTAATYVAWCSLALEPDDPVAGATEFGLDRLPLPRHEFEEELRKRLSLCLQESGKVYDLTHEAGREAIQERIRSGLQLFGFRTTAFSFRRVLTSEAYSDAKIADLKFQHDLEKLLHDAEIWKAAERGRLDKALAELEGDRVRALLTEDEKTLQVERRVAKYVELFGSFQLVCSGPSQFCPHPHCRTDLSMGETFVCSRCGNRLHVWHRAFRAPIRCDQCQAVVTGRRRVLLGWAAAVAIVSAGAWAVLEYGTGPDVQPPDPLTVHWYGFGQRFEDSGWRQFQVRDGMELYHGDQFRLAFSPSDDCYAYIVNVAPDGSVSRLFPNPAIGLQNPCRRHETYEVPDGLNWFTLDDSPGVETLFLVASLEARTDLEAVLARPAGELAARQSGRDIQRLMKNIEIEQGAGAKPPQGVATRSAISTRAVVIEADHRVVPEGLAPPVAAAAVERAVRGVGTAVQPIQFSHIPPRATNRSHD